MDKLIRAATNTDNYLEYGHLAVIQGVQIFDAI